MLTKKLSPKNILIIRRTLFAFLGFLAIATGTLVFKAPVQKLANFHVLIGVTALARATLLVLNYLRHADRQNYKLVARFLLGLAVFALGIIVIGNFSDKIATNLPFLVAGWFILEAMVSLVDVHHWRKFGGAIYVMNIILNWLLVLVAVVILYRPATQRLADNIMTGLAFLFFGIKAMLLSIFLKVDNNQAKGD